MSLTKLYLDSTLMRLCKFLYLFFILQTSIAQDLSGYWQGIEVIDRPDTNILLYFPTLLTLKQSVGTIKGEYFQTNFPKSTIYGQLEITSGNINANRVYIVFDRLIKSNAIWCMGSANLTYFPKEEKLQGYETFIEPPKCTTHKATLELYRIILKSRSKFCKGEIPSLAVTGKNIKWYADSLGLQLLGQGNTFKPMISQTTTFYVTQTHYDTESPPVPVSIEIAEDNCSQTIYLPTSFTPNNDNINDGWQVFFPSKTIKVIDFRVFDRWGNGIFERQNYTLNSGDIIWDGMSQDRKLNVGVFAYAIEVQLETNKSSTFKGSVQILK